MPRENRNSSFHDIFDNLLTDFDIYRRRMMPCLLFFPAWVVAFFVLDFMQRSSYYVVQSNMDSHIPFVPQFVWFYYLWYLYFIGGIIFFFLQKDGEEYYQLVLNLILGMSVFLVLAIFFPTYLPIREVISNPSGASEHLVAFIQSHDTPTNVFPSLHVFNALAVTHAITNSHLFEKRRGVCITAWVVCIGIILSTVFIKQHSVIDVAGAFAMQAVFYYFIYGRRAEAGERIAMRMVRWEG